MPQKSPFNAPVTPFVYAFGRSVSLKPFGGAFFPVISHAAASSLSSVPEQRAFFIRRASRDCPGLGATRPVVLDAFVAARLTLPLIQVEILP